MVRIGEYTQQRAKVGLFGIGLEAYWDQFDGLKERLGGYRTLKIGNTNSRIRFSWPPAAFVNAWCEQGPTHHCVLSVGHHADTPRKVARLLGLEFVEVEVRERPSRLVRIRDDANKNKKERTEPLERRPFRSCSPQAPER